MTKKFLSLRSILSKITDFFLGFVVLFVLMQNFTAGLVNPLIYTAAPIISLLIEAFFICAFKASPGKILLGIRIQQQNGKNLSFQTAFTRAFKELFLFFRPKSLQVFDKHKQIMVSYLKGNLPRIAAFLVLCAIMLKTVFQPGELDEMKVPAKTIEQQTKKNWQNFTPDNGEFSLLFPSKPGYHFEKIPIPKTTEFLPYHEYKVEMENEAVTYSISSTELPGRWLSLGPKLLLKGSIKILAENLPKTKVGQTMVHGVNGHPVLDYKMKQGDRELLGRLFLIKNSLYRVEAAYPIAEKMHYQDDVAAFIASFQWVPKEQRAITKIAEENANDE